MEHWGEICQKLIQGESIESIKNLLDGSFQKYRVYKDSIHQLDNSFYMIAIVNGEKKLVISYKNNQNNDFIGEETAIDDFHVKICALNHENCNIIRKLFSFVNPRSHKGYDTTLGLGDRLGLASPGHIRVLKGKRIFPIFAQQSIRELNLTGRTYNDVLDDASWAVFQEGYTSGFGADGDHLKSKEEVKMALDCGFTMITLDCSEHINDRVFYLSESEIKNLYLTLDDDERQYLESKYLNKDFSIEGNEKISFSYCDLMKTSLIYHQAIDFAVSIYNEIIKTYPRQIDFEISIDETSVPTTPEAHFFVANELINRNVEILSLAPRFHGEFQKGIDYKGDIEEFRRNFITHQKIADTFGYKISVHSGSDKFSVFPIIGEITRGKVHVKTAGTNWLEAVRVIASVDPALYREMHIFALDKLQEAKKYYHITENVANIPDISKLNDSELPGLMDMNDSRQVLHVTYGMILQSKNPDGSYTFRDRIYKILNKHEDVYYQNLERHIGRHIDLLGINN